MTDSLPIPIHEELINTRRDLHAHPELGFQEIRTSGVVASRLEKYGFEVRTGIAKTGVTGLLRGGHPGPVLAIRADMDCLPIQEENDIPYRSRTAGLMHACGHDGHTAIALAVARVLASRREDLHGSVKFIFQPAEETLGGAAPMVAEGVLDNPHVDAIVGLHLWNSMPVGQIGVLNGPIMAATGNFRVTIKGKGGHGAAPQTTVDPIVAACHCITSVQSVVARNVDPLQPAVVTVGSFQAGSAVNIIPDEATFMGTIRSFNNDVHALLESRTREVVQQVAAAFGCTVEWDYKPGYPVTVNHPDIAEIVRNAARDVVGPEQTVEAEATLGGEDFAFFLRERPGCFFFVGSANSEKGLDYPHHNPRFNIDEAALPIGALVMLKTAERYLSAPGT